MVAQGSLEAFVMVRIHVGQPIYFPNKINAFALFSVFNIAVAGNLARVISGLKSGFSLTLSLTPPPRQ